MRIRIIPDAMGGSNGRGVLSWPSTAPWGRAVAGTGAPIRTSHGGYDLPNRMSRAPGNPQRGIGPESAAPTAAWPIVAWLSTVALLSACTVGPDFKRPQPPTAPTYTEQPLPAATVDAPVPAGASQQFIAGRDLQKQWWTLFRSEPLDRLVEAALRDNPSVAQAKAALRQARENLAAERGSLWPSVVASGGVAREREAAAVTGLPYAETFTLYNASVGVSYAFDIFGGVRRQLEALQAQVDVGRYQLDATYLALTANVANAAFREASLRAQWQAIKDIEQLQQRQLDVVERRFSLGAVAKSDVLAQRTALAQTHASLAPLERQVAQARDQLAIYIGRAPSEAQLPRFDLENLQLPVELPVAVPSTLVRQRPDILAAESLLHAASAQVGVATADLYPKLTLSASAGVDAFKASKLFESNAFGWSIGAGIVAPIFNGGQLQARRRAAEAAYDAAAASYQQTILSAFGGVADALNALDADARTLQADADAQAQARAALDLAQSQFGAGAVSYLALLNAQQQYQQTRVALVQAQADRYADTVALFTALGGGWWDGDERASASNP